MNRPLTVRKERKGEFAGVGALVQAVGVALPFGGYYAASSAGDTPATGGIVGAILGAVVLVIGGRMALRWVCGACKTPLANGSVQMCPTCHAHLT